MTLFDRDKWQEIFGTMRKHKLRTALTALGVFWGIFMLIFALGMGSGLQNGAYSSFGERAKNVMYVWPSSTSKPYRGFPAGRRARFKIDDIYAIQNSVPEVKYIAPRTNLGNLNISKGVLSEEFEVRGELTDMIFVEALKVYQGRYINDRDIEQARKVAIIGTRVEEVLFGEEDCLGASIQINGIDFTVVGTFGPTEIKPWTEDEMQSVVIPLTTMEKSFGTQGRIDFFICGADKNVRVSAMEPKVRSVLKARHHIAPDDPQGIGGFNLEERFLMMQNLFTGINLLLWIVGIGTLLAGIVGVSNIMIIIVKERTKEIGIRKALGATPGSIVNMILTESVFLTSISGYMGLIVGTGIIYGLNKLLVMNDVDIEYFVRPEVNIYVGFAAILILVIAGTLAGLIPALQASRVRPVVALKDE